MVADGVVLIDRLRQVVTEYDPRGLVTMGWYALAFQPEWYVDSSIPNDLACKSPSWVGWREVSMVAAEASGDSCLISAPAVRFEPRSSAPLSTRLGTRQRVLVEACLSSDARWLRVPGDHR